MTLTQMRAESEMLCRKIMGDDYIAHTELTKAFGWQYNHSQINALERSIPKLEMLEALKARNYMLVPTPNVYCDSRMIQGLSENGTFGEPDPDWFTGDIMLAGHWLAFHKGPYPESGNKTWKQQAALLTTDEYVPNHTEAEYAVRLYNYLRDGDLFAEFDGLRTSGINTHYHVPITTDDGLGMVMANDEDAYDTLGLAAAYKL